MMSDQIRRCPSCGGRLRDEGLGWRCEKCKGFVDMQGKFHKHVERPFMPPMTNADRIRSMSDTELAELLLEVHVEGADSMQHILLRFHLTDEQKRKLIEEATPAAMEWLRQPKEEDDNGKI